MASAVLKLSVVLLVAGVCGADVFGGNSMSDVCMGCICEAVSGCNRTLQCEGDRCGLFHISWPYWADAGKPTLSGDDPNESDAYPNCTTDPFCASRTVERYMRKYAQDCNGDDRVDCFDFLAIHKLGGYGCTGKLPSKYVDVFNKCMSSSSEVQD